MTVSSVHVCQGDLPVVLNLVSQLGVFFLCSSLLNLTNWKEKEETIFAHFAVHIRS